MFSHPLPIIGGEYTKSRNPTHSLPSTVPLSSTHALSCNPTYSHILPCTPHYWWCILHKELKSHALTPFCSTVNRGSSSTATAILDYDTLAPRPINRCNNWMIASAFVLFAARSYFPVLFCTFAYLFCNDWYPCHSRSGCNNWIIGCTMASQTCPFIKYEQANSKTETHFSSCGHNQSWTILRDLCNNSNRPLFRGRWMRCRNADKMTENESSKATLSKAATEEFHQPSIVRVSIVLGNHPEGQKRSRERRSVNQDHCIFFNSILMMTTFTSLPMDSKILWIYTSI